MLLHCLEEPIPDSCSVFQLTQQRIAVLRPRILVEIEVLVSLYRPCCVHISFANCDVGEVHAGGSSYTRARTWTSVDSDMTAPRRGLPLCVDPYA